MSLPAVNYGVTLEIETCCTCGLAFGIPAERREKLLRTGEQFYCPSGHPQHYTETTVQKLQKQLDAAKRDADWQRQRREQTEKSLSAQRGLMTKLKRRIGNGVCPCCKRSFGNLHHHMQTEHPDYGKESA